jgi:hypothetical protein
MHRSKVENQTDIAPALGGIHGGRGASNIRWAIRPPRWPVCGYVLGHPLAKGFLRLQCVACGREELVAFNTTCVGLWVTPNELSAIYEI